MTREQVLAQQYAVPGKIAGFFGHHRFLSNFHYPAHLIIGGVSWPTTEHMFQACKIARPVEPVGSLVQFVAGPAAVEYDQWFWRIQRAPTPAEAKRQGRLCPLRPDWDQVKDECMLALTMEKYGQNPDLAAALLQTGDFYLEETNWWGDQYWGVCDEEGRNKLGHILMQVRTKLKASWP